MYIKKCAYNSINDFSLKENYINHRGFLKMESNIDVYLTKLNEAITRIGIDHEIYRDLLLLQVELNEIGQDAKRVGVDDNWRVRKNIVLDKLNSLFIENFNESFTSNLDLNSPSDTAPFQLSFSFFQGLLDSFVNRESEIKLLKRLLVDKKAKTVAFCGMGGIGKSTLAKKTYEVLKRYFPGGLLWADFQAHRGDVLTILFSWAQILNHPEVNLIRSPQIRAQAVGKLIYEYTQRSGNLLAIFDDVRETKDFPWLDGAHLLKDALPDNVPVIITSRQTEVAQSLRAKIIDLDVLRTKEAVRLLMYHLEGVEINPAEAVKLVESVGNLPLATEVIAGMVQVEGLDWTFRKVNDKYQRIDSLHSGDLKSKADNVYLSFEASYMGLEEDQKTIFKLLGIFAPGYIEQEWIVRIINGNNIEDISIEDSLRKLCNRGLLKRIDLKYRLHPLLNDYARSLLRKDGQFDQWETKHKNFFNLYLERNCYDFEYVSKAIGNILNAEQIAYEHFLWDDVISFVFNLSIFGKYLYVRGLWTEAIKLLEHGITACQNLGKTKELSQLFWEIGTLQRESGNYSKAFNYFSQSYAICKEANDIEGMASASFGQGYVYLYRAEYDEAKKVLEEAVSLAESSNNELALGEALRGLGRIEISIGSLDSAEKILVRSEQVLKKVGDQQGLAYNYRGLGEIFTLRNNSDVDRSLYFYHQGLSIAEEIGDPQAQAYILRGIGDAYKKGENYLEALKAYRQSESLYRMVGDQAALAGTLCSIGEVLVINEKIKDAKKYFQESEKISLAVGQPRWQARSLLGKAKVALEEGNREEAVKLSKRAMRILRKIKHRDEKLVQEWLHKIGEENEL
jgi:tetratricopeptide (TPR) repeat protein